MHQGKISSTHIVRAGVTGVDRRADIYSTNTDEEMEGRGNLHFVNRRVGHAPRSFRVMSAAAAAAAAGLKLYIGTVKYQKHVPVQGRWAVAQPRHC